MGIDVLKVVGDSFNTLLKNKTVAVFAIIGALISAAFSFIITSQVQAIHGALGGASSVATALPFMASFLGAFSIGVLIIYLVNIFIEGSVMTAASDAKKDPGAAASQAISRYLYFLVTSIITGIVVAIGFVLLVIPGIYLAVKLSIAPVEAVVGKKGVMDSLKSSWDATNGNAWSVFFAGLVTLIAVILISLIATGIFALAGVQSIGQFIGTFFGYAFPVLLVLIYQQIGMPAKKGTRRRQ